MKIDTVQIDHVGIAVRSLDDALATYKQLWNLEPDHIERGETDKVTEAMLPIGDTHLQLLEATDDESTIAKFIARRGEGLHHIAIRVGDIEHALAALAAEGAELIDTEPRIGGGGHRVAFVHPKTTHGVLIELVEHVG
ncbi:MAG TPA: methylmalonyl-CoA epimerase [Actinomycetota bacterium]|nr:methylmalonyl-CoA epimerase [Actinomycetota bacterium]